MPTNPHQHRRVTWMELFFDLVFVAAVAEVGKPLSADFSLDGLVRYGFLFALIWWAWSGHTLYSTRFDTDDTVHRLLILLQCFIAAVMAANAKDALDSRSSAGFGAAYAGMRLMLVLQYLRARRFPETRRLTTRFAVGFGAAAVLWIASALTEPPVRYWLWAIALAIDGLTPWLAEKHGRMAPPHAAHFPERFGLFTIILLGELVTEVMRGIASQEYWSVPDASTALAGMAFAFGLRWWYFDIAQAAAERHVRTKHQARLFQVWNYSHFPLFLGIGVAGVGFKHLIALQSNARLHHAEARILFFAAAVLVVALTTIGATSEGPRKRLWPQFLIASALVVLGNYADHLHKVVVAGVLLLSCVGSASLLVSEGRRLTKRTAADFSLEGEG